MWSKIANLLSSQRNESHYIDDLMNTKTSERFDLYKAYASHKGSRFMFGVGDPAPLEHAVLVCVDMRLAIWLEQVTPEELAQQAIHFCKPLKTKEGRKYIVSRQVLMDIVEIMSFQKVKDRTLVREVLSYLYWARGHIPHNLYFPTRTERESVTHRVMRNFVVKHVAGWHLDMSDSKFNWEADSFLDLPIGDSPEMFRSHAVPLGIALYRLHDLDLVLKLLRHGAYPSLLVLWPYALRLFPSSPDDESMKRVQAACTRIIMLWSSCRISFQVELLDRSQTDWLEQTYLRANLLEDELTPALVERPIDWPSERVNQPKDVLLWPRGLSYLLPSDRYNEPAPLKHLCRMAIRSIMDSLDKVPSGLDELGLPKPLRDYLQLYAYH